MVEQTRISVFDTITQYRALFSDEETHVGAISAKNAGLLGSNAPVSYRLIFSSWIYHRITHFQKMLFEAMENFEAVGGGGQSSQAHQQQPLDLQSLESRVGQLMYFGQSLGRVGFDMRLLFVTPLVELIRKRLRLTLKEGENSLTLALEQSNTIYDVVVHDKIVISKLANPNETPEKEVKKQETKVTEEMPTEEPKEGDDATNDSEAKEVDTKSEAESPSEAPVTLKPSGVSHISYYPLAMVYNTVMSVFNDFRFVMPAVVGRELVGELRTFLANVDAIFAGFVSRDATLAGARAINAPTSGEERSYALMHQEFRSVIVPCVESYKMTFQDQVTPMGIDFCDRSRELFVTAA